MLLGCSGAILYTKSKMHVQSSDKHECMMHDTLVINRKRQDQIQKSFNLLFSVTEIWFLLVVHIGEWNESRKASMVNSWVQNKNVEGLYRQPSHFCLLQNNSMVKSRLWWHLSVAWKRKFPLNTEEQLEVPLFFMRAQAIRLCSYTDQINYQHNIQLAKLPFPISSQFLNQGIRRQDQLQATHFEGENLWFNSNGRQ
jgi:hypothetical protein